MASAINASKLLRGGLLEGTSVLIAADAGPLPAALRSACAALGASVGECAPHAPGFAEQREGAAALWGEVDLLVVDGAGMFAAAQRGQDAQHGEDADGGDSRAALLACLDGAWEATEAVANAAFIAPGRPGRIVYIAPHPGAGAHADAARAGLENLARTLSIEWARRGVRPVAIATGRETGEQQLAALVAYIASPAGSYLSGCLLDLRGGAGEPPR